MNMIRVLLFITALSANFSFRAMAQEPTPVRLATPTEGSAVMSAEVIQVTTPPAKATPVEVVTVPPVAPTTPVAPAVTPALIPQPNAAPVISAAPTPTAKQASTEIKNACSESFASPYQEKLRPICSEGATFAAAKDLQTSIDTCRISHKDQDHAQMVCIIGSSIGEDIRKNQTTYKDKLAACRDLYPITTQIDVYLQEACLTGIHQHLSVNKKPSLERCRSISNDRSFVAPCGVGLSIAYDMAQNNLGSSKSHSLEENKICLQYFDKAAFHLGYRSCLNARSLILADSGKKKDIVKQCNDIISNNKSEAERAACIVGSSLFQSLERDAQSASARFKNCGDTKVNYEEHSTLACLTAVSLLDFMDKDHARKACKEVFTGRKSKSRTNCIDAVR